MKRTKQGFAVAKPYAGRVKAAARPFASAALLLAFLLTSTSCIVHTGGDYVPVSAVSKADTSSGGSGASPSASASGSALSSVASAFSSLPDKSGSAATSAKTDREPAVAANAQGDGGGDGGGNTPAASDAWPSSGPVPSPLDLPARDGTDVFANASVSIDLSYTSYGFVKIHLVKAVQGAVKVWIHKSSGDYYYDLSASGDTEIYPLQMGSGGYSVSVLRKGSGGSYYYLASTNVNVQLASSLDPFLVPNQIVSYTSGSTAVSVARGLVSGMHNNYQRISTVLSYVASHLSYDYSLAKTAPTSYVPDVDEDLARGKGICYDYAAVSAVMLRSLGYPTKLMTGYVEDGSVYHAWNEVYLEGQGWIKVMSVRLSMTDWSRVDVTFISTSNSSASVAKYIENAGNYRTVYTY